MRKSAGELKGSQHEMRYTASSHTILINRIIKKSGFDFGDTPTEEEVRKQLGEDDPAE